MDGSSHIVHVEEETGGTRLAIDASTCLLEAEADPSKLVSASPGVCRVDWGEPVLEFLDSCQVCSEAFSD